jgi:hypothetical protein
VWCTLLLELILTWNRELQFLTTSVIFMLKFIVQLSFRQYI